MKRVRAPSRLHFGLFHVPDGRTHWPAPTGNGPPIRQFGGVGLMIASPEIQVAVTPATAWSATGPLAERALAIAQKLTQTPQQIVIEKCPPEHVGLGSGTQLSLALAAAIQGQNPVLTYALNAASQLERGTRSGIGIYGFALGGLIVDGGRLENEKLPILVGRYAFPIAWRIVLIRPTLPTTWFGQQERSAFQELTRNGSDQTDVLCRLVLLGMLPAMFENDCAAFGEAVYEFNYRVGERFAQAQGGIYAHPALADIVRYLRHLGVTGVGQSSWGPTLFAIVPSDEQAAWLVRELRTFVPIDTELTITSVSGGARLVE